MGRRWPGGRCQRLPTRIPNSLRATVVCLLAAALGTTTPTLAQDQDDRPPDSEQVAILGFTNLGGAPALAWIGPGTVESVRADLGSFGLRVVSAATV